MAVTHAVELIVGSRERTPPERSTLVAVSGIDASGKGFVAAH